MFTYTRRNGTQHTIGIDMNDVHDAHVDKGISWYNMRNEFGAELTNRQMQTIRESDEWAEVVEGYAIVNGIVGKEFEAFISDCIKAKPKAKVKKKVEVKKEVKVEAKVETKTNSWLGKKSLFRCDEDENENEDEDEDEDEEVIDLAIETDDQDLSLFDRPLDEVKALEAKVKEQEEVIKHLKENTKSLLKSNNDLARENEHYEHETAEMKEELNDVNALNYELESQVLRLQIDIEDLKQDREDNFDDFQDIRPLIIKLLHPDKNHQLLSSQNPNDARRYSEFTSMIMTLLWNKKRQNCLDIYLKSWYDSQCQLVILIAFCDGIQTLAHPTLEIGQGGFANTKK